MSKAKVEKEKERRAAENAKQNNIIEGLKAERAKRKHCVAIRSTSIQYFFI